MPKKKALGFREAELNKGQLRKLTALRKSLGDKIADKAFAEWLSTQAKDSTEPEDKTAKLIVDTLEPLRAQNKLRIPRGGHYLVKSGRGRVNVELVTPK